LKIFKLWPCPRRESEISNTPNSFSGGIISERSGAEFLIRLSFIYIIFSPGFDPNEVIKSALPSSFMPF
jgi:hypothetical protein